MRMPPDNYELARDLAAKGYIPVAMLAGTKVPAESAWQEWPGRPITEDSIARRWRGTRHGVAILCHDLAVIDVDAPDLLETVLEDCGLTDAPVCRTPGGGYHVHARVRRGVELKRTIRVKGRPIDLLTGRSLSILPPHVGEGGVAYEWLTDGLPEKSRLPLTRIGWTRERVKKAAKAVVSWPEGLPAEKGSIRFPESYCMAIKSEQGNNGSRGLVRVVCVMRDAGRTPDQIFAYVKAVWGPVCATPEWSDKEVWHCIHRHCR